MMMWVSKVSNYDALRIVLYFALSKFWHHGITKPYLINEKKSTIAIHIQSRYNKINKGTNGEKMDASIFISTGSAK